VYLLLKIYKEDIMIEQSIFTEIMKDTVEKYLIEEKPLFDLYGEAYIKDIYQESNDKKKSIVKFDFLDNPKEVVEFVIVAINFYKAIKWIISMIKIRGKKESIEDAKDGLKEDLTNAGMIEEKVTSIIENFLKLVEKVV
jgi:hypothetical protein